MMNFDKLIFKEYYGKPYLNLIKFTLIFDLIVAVIVGIIMITGVIVSTAIAFILLTLLFLSFFVLILLFSYYIKALKMSQRQKQWFSNGVLHVLLVPVNGFTWGAIINQKKEYIFNSISSVNVTSRYIEIVGQIQMIEEYNQLTEIKNISVCKVPRNFANEDEILKIGGVRNGN